MKKINIRIFLIFTFSISITSSFPQNTNELEVYSKSINTYKGQIFSIVDSLPMAGFYFSFNRGNRIISDSIGYFTFPISKYSTIQSATFHCFYFDTLVRLKSLNDTVRLYVPREYDSILAKFDIQHGNIRLFCGKSFMPMALTEADQNFEKKYNIKYYIIGDYIQTGTWPYNKTVIEYMDNRYGNTWRITARNDVEGLKN